MQRPRIIHYISELNVGGTERQLLVVLPALQQFADNHVVCAIGAGAIGPRLYQQGIPVHYLGGKSNFDPRPTMRLRRLVQQLQPDILTTYLSYADLTARLTPLPSSHYLVSSQRSSYLNQNYLRHLDRLTKQKVHHYVCQTPTAHQQICHSHRLAEHQCSVIPNAVATKNSTPKTLRQHLRISNQDLIISCISTLKPGKGHADLITSFAAVHKTHPHTHLLIVGDGPLREDLVTQAQAVSPKNIHFLGHQDNIDQILAISDMFVLPTYGEGMSNAVLEAMAAGLPILTTNILPNQDLITDNQTGLLCPPADTTCLTEKINQLIENPNLRQQLGHATQQYVTQNHHVNHIAQKWYQLYQDLLKTDD